MRYFPPYETAGLATFFVKSWRRVPRPPAKIIANILSCFIKSPLFHNTTSLVYSFLCDIARILHRKNKKIAKIMEKFIENHLLFFTKKENKENQINR